MLFGIKILLQGLFDSNSQVNGHANHGGAKGAPLLSIYIRQVQPIMGIPKGKTEEMLDKVI